MRNPQLYSRDVVERAVVVHAVATHVHVVPRLVVDAQIGGYAGGGEPVERHPGDNLGVCPGVGVCPLVQFLVQPGEEACWAGGERAAESLRFCALRYIVAHSVGRVGCCAGEAGAFVRGVGG